MDLKSIKNWNVEIEKEITEKWKNAEMFRFDKNLKKKIYSIDTPPPYINAPIHMGHAVTYCFQDFFARYKRMKGFQVLFPLGLDRNGLPIETGAEKKYKISPFGISRDEFLGYCEKLLNETSTESIETLARLGISFTSYLEGDDIGSVYLTDSPKYRTITQATFIDLFLKGLIYEDNRVSNWDPKLRTTIADSEIEYKDIISSFNDVKWKIKETGEEVVIGTTRPELMCSCGMVIYNPEDERYKHLEGKTAIVPIFGTEVKITAHPFAQMDKGTGLVMMCSAGDLTDIQFFREKGIRPIISIGMDGKMNDNAKEYSGLKVKEAREKIISDLKEKGLLVKQEQITHRTPISERSKAEIEFIEMPEFYLEQLDLKEKVREIADNINFYPENSRKILDSWIDSISIDWPISRRRFYATPIPLWHCKKEGLIAVPRAGKYFQPWKEDAPWDSDVLKNGQKVGVMKDFLDKTWEGETRVLDTWFDSSISELVMLQYKRDDEFFAKSFPASLRPQGKEIVRTWLYYTLLRGYLETGKACFNDVWIHQHILDGRGKKMSKSDGNVINPQDILKEDGAEALRLWASIEGDLSKGDFICSREKIRAEKKTLNKLINVSKFVFNFLKPKGEVKLTGLDKLFIDYVENLTKKVDSDYSKYDFNHSMQELRQFLWDVFASNYIELVKNRVYNQEGNFSFEESESARYTLYFLLERFLLLTYPVIPQVTSLIANEMGIDLLHSEFPKFKLGESDLMLVSNILDFNSLVWKAKKDQGISLRDSISGIVIPVELENFSSDLKACHSLD